MKHIVILLALLAPVLSYSQNEEATPSLYEWFYPSADKEEVAVVNSAGIKTLSEIKGRFRKRADRYAMRWKRKADKEREKADKLQEQIKALKAELMAKRDEVYVRERNALFFEAEKAKILQLKFK